MKLTGKCKQDFEKWFVEWYADDFYYLTPSKDINSINFQRLTKDMQYGVYVDFFDSVGVKIRILTTKTNFFYAIGSEEGGIETRPKAREQAIIKANEIYNESTQKMKALSIRHIWAFLIANGIKDIENRTWRTNFRGRVYIHVPAKKSTNNKHISLMELYMLGLTEEMIIDAKNKDFNFNKIEYSTIIGEVDIVDCVINHKSIWAENNIGIPQDGKIIKPIYNWVLDNAVLYDEPILNVKGKLSFWEFNKALIKAEKLKNHNT